VPAATDRLEFTPPPGPGLWRSVALALLAHGLLLVALTLGVQWKRQAPTTVSAQAELWAQVPQEAAPKPVEATPAPPPAAAAPPSPAVVELPKVDIAREQEKARKQLQKEKDLARQREDRQKQEKLKQEQLKQEQVKRDKLAQDKKRTEERQQAEARRKAADEEKRSEALRQENMKRIAGMAGATGPAGATGTAQQSAGPSASYGGRIRAKIRPNIVFTEDISGNASAEVEVRSSPDGTILSRKLVKSSGVKAWDDAVLKAIDKTETLPRDVDGRVPSPLVISFRPKD
jgi:colicin import membrane protein